MEIKQVVRSDDSAATLPLGWKKIFFKFFKLGEIINNKFFKLGKKILFLYGSVWMKITCFSTDKNYAIGTFIAIPTLM